LAEPSAEESRGVHPRDYAPAHSVTSLEHARRIAAIAQDKLAEEIVLLDMREVCSFTDYFLICSGRNARQTKGVYDEIHLKMKQESRVIPRTVAGEREAEWIVIDYIDVVVHVFTPELRAYYRLEDLWNDVPRVELDTAA
jgi:ribosome-associated protein